MQEFADVETLTFDCYGTLVDWESGIADALCGLLAAKGRRFPRERVLAQFASVEHQVQSAVPGLLYPRILERVAHIVAAHFGVVIRPAEAHAFGASIGDWPPFPDTSAALARLASRFRLAVISNVDRASFARTNARLRVAFDAVVTAEDTGFWKPDARMFEAAFARLAALGITKERTLHVAQSLFHDHVPAQRFGLRTAFVDRYGGTGGATPAPGADVRPNITVGTLTELADALEIAPPRASR